MASLVGPLNLNTVIIASLIVLLPGMALTNAMNELTSRHLVSGTARFAGAMTTILKLTIGTAIALNVAHLVGIGPGRAGLAPAARMGGMERAGDGCVSRSRCCSARTVAIIRW